MYLPTAEKMETGKKKKILHDQSFLMKYGWWLPVKQRHSWTLINFEDFRITVFILEMRNQRLQNTTVLFLLAKK